MTWLHASVLDLFALAFAPFAGVLLWALALRHLELEPEAAGARLRAPPDLVPVFAWASRLRREGALGREAAWRALLELGAVVVAIWALAEAPRDWTWPACALGWLLLAASVIDARERILPDEINLALAGLGLAAALPLGTAVLIDHAIGAAVGLAVFAAFAWGYARLRGREGLGLGDAKLLGALGAWVGWQGLASIVVIAAGAALAAVIVGGALRRRLPQGADETRFGPFIALGGWLTWLYGPLGFIGMS